MKFTLSLCLLFITQFLQAQIEEGLLLEIHKGSTIEINNSTPNMGALVYNTDNNFIYKYDGSSWKTIGEAISITDTITGGHPIVRITDGNQSTDIKETITKIEDNNDGTVSYINEIQDTTTFAISPCAGFPPIVAFISPNICIEDGETYEFEILGDYFATNSVVTIANQTVNSIKVYNSEKIVANVTIGNFNGNTDLSVSNNNGTTTLSPALGPNSLFPYSLSNIAMNSRMTYTNSQLRKVNTNNSWNGAAFSRDRYIPKKNIGELKFKTVGNENQIVMLGLNSDPATSSSYGNIDYAIYLHTKRIYIYESGSSKGYKGVYASGDTFSIKKDCEGKINYYKNGTKFYTSVNLAANTKDLYFDSSFYRTNGATTYFTDLILEY